MTGLIMSDGLDLNGQVKTTDLAFGAANRLFSCERVNYGQIGGTETTIASLAITPITENPIDISVVYGVNCNVAGIDDTEFKVKVSGGKFAYDAAAQFGYSAGPLIVTRKILSSQFASGSMVVDSVALTELPKASGADYGTITVEVTAKKTGGTWAGVFPIALITAHHAAR